MSESESRYWRTPKKPRLTNAKSAWWYANRTDVEVYAETSSGTVRVVLSRRQLEAYIKRTKAAHD